MVIFDTQAESYSNEFPTTPTESLNKPTRTDHVGENNPQQRCNTVKHLPRVSHNGPFPHWEQFQAAPPPILNSNPVSWQNNYASNLNSSQPLYQQPFALTQHFKPTAPATSPHSTFTANSFTRQLPVYPLRVRDVTVGQNENGSLPESLRFSALHLPNIASTVTHQTYLQSDVLPSIAQQSPQLFSTPIVNPFSGNPVTAIPFSPAPVGTGNSAGGSGVVANTPCHNTSNSTAPSWSEKDRFLESQNFPFSFQPTNENIRQEQGPASNYQGDYLSTPTFVHPSLLSTNLSSMPATNAAFSNPSINFPLVSPYAALPPGHSSTEYFPNTMNAYVQEGGKYFCETCQKEFPSRYRLKSHSLVHTAVKAFRCSTCGKRFGRSHDMKRHMRSHEMDHKSLVCAECGKSFSRADALRRHMRLICRCLPASSAPE